MATLVLSAVGTAIGGPLGGALGALIGNQFDQVISGSPKREGPRLKELSVTTSSYGTAIARHYGQVRTPGSIIWATDLVETKEKSGGSKGKPSIATYSYAASFAVALASRPIKGIGRIWADGNLLRGGTGDLKVGGEFRVYLGHGDQPRDPLIASDRGGACPAFRNIAYCVFESLQLANFGNRIPGLTFELIADDGEISIESIVSGIGRSIDASRPLPDLVGYSNEGGSIAANLATIDQLYPVSFELGGRSFRFLSSDALPKTIPILPVATAARDEGDSFGPLSGQTSRRQTRKENIPVGVRYYDTARDFQTGLQRVDGQAQRGADRLIEFPGALPAAKAKELANAAFQRNTWSSEILSWRITEIDTAFGPGKIVHVPGRPGIWRIDSWEWRDSGVELELHRMPPGRARHVTADAGEILAPVDKVAEPTVLHAFEAPWTGVGSWNERQVYAAVSSVGAGWTGAAIYAETDGALTYLQPSESRRSLIGSLVESVQGTSSAIMDRYTRIRIEFLSNDLDLVRATVRGLDLGENRLLIGDEVLQFGNADAVDAGVWELSRLLRGRGGTEAAALRGHEAGSTVVLLDNKVNQIELADPLQDGLTNLAAIGLADTEPVMSTIANLGMTRKPLTPVHPRASLDEAGTLHLTWTRRARGSWRWLASEIPLSETTERYVVGVGDTSTSKFGWDVSEPIVSIGGAMIAELNELHGGDVIWVRQVGSYSMSDPVVLHRLA